MWLLEAKLQGSPIPRPSFWCRKVPREVLLSACGKRGTGDEAIALELPPQGKNPR